MALVINGQVVNEFIWWQNVDNFVLNHIAIKHDLLKHIDANWVHGGSWLTIMKEWEFMHDFFMRILFTITNNFVITTLWGVICFSKMLLLSMGVMDVLCSNKMFVALWGCLLCKSVLLLFEWLVMTS
jgi:hypothetical protein